MFFLLAMLMLSTVNGWALQPDDKAHDSSHELAITGEADGARDGKLPCARPIDFALVLDESGSMSGYMEGKNGLKAFAKELVRQTAIEPR
jgi:uncharacterized protein with von Willebrand factor type A (vWA) domain